MSEIQINHLELYLDENRLVNKPKVQKLLGISRSTLARRIGSGAFPSPCIIQRGRSYWRFKVVNEWLSCNR